MPYPAGTNVRICNAIGLPITFKFYLEKVDDALRDSETYGGEAAIALVTGYLTKYEAAETQLNADTGNAGLKKADVLEWFEGARASGFSNEMKRLRQLLIDVLGLQHLVDDYGSKGSSKNRVQILRG